MTNTPAPHPDLILVQNAVATLTELAAQKRPEFDRLRAMEKALRDLREGTTCLSVLIREAKARGTPEKVAGWHEMLGGALAGVAEILPILAAETKARKGRLSALLAVTRQRAQVEQGYRPARGGRIAMVQRQVHHCVHVVA